MHAVGTQISPSLHDGVDAALSLIIREKIIGFQKFKFLIEKHDFLNFLLNGNFICFGDFKSSFRCFGNIANLPQI